MHRGLSVLILIGAMTTWGDTSRPAEAQMGAATERLAPEVAPSASPLAPAAQKDSDEDSATASIVDRAGKRVGLATLEETPNGTMINVEFTGLAPGVHAFHIHAVGKCDPPFESAGPHFNPTGAAHGMAIGKGYHAGDLPNVFVPASGNVHVELLVPRVTVRSGAQSVFDADGSALVVHVDRDDHKTDPAGNAGDRIACGVIER